MHNAKLGTAFSLKWLVIALLPCCCCLNAIAYALYAKCMCVCIYEYEYMQNALYEYMYVSGMWMCAVLSIRCCS